MATHEFNEPSDQSDGEARGPDGMRLGPYESYQEYLRSQEWRELREQALGRDGGRCMDCGAYATEVHHRFYPRHIGETELDHLISLCRSCHSDRPTTGTPLSPKEKRENLMSFIFRNSSDED